MNLEIRAAFCLEEYWPIFDLMEVKIKTFQKDFSNPLVRRQRDCAANHVDFDLRSEATSRAAQTWTGDQYYIDQRYIDCTFYLKCSWGVMEPAPRVKVTEQKKPIGDLKFNC